MTMSDSPPSHPNPSSGFQPPRQRRGFIRGIVLPVLVVAAIVGIIWWIDRQRSGGATSQSGVLYGPIDLPSTSASPNLSVGPEEGRLAPDFLLEGLDGHDMRLTDLRGKPIVVNFWASWCRPCRQEMPNLVKAYDTYRERGLVIVGVDLQEGRSLIQPFATEFGMDFPIAIDRTGSVGDEYRLLGLPTTFFVDPSGIVRSRFNGPFLEQANGTNVQGAIDASDLNKRIEEILP